MPLGPLPANTTGRVHIKYTANGKNHVVSPRYAGVGAPSADFLEGVDGWLIAANPFMPTDWAFIEWTYQAAGSVVSVPLAGAPTAFSGDRVPKQWDKAGYGDVVGRDTLGRRVKLTLLGWAYAPDEVEAEGDEYRLYASEGAGFADYIAAVEASLIVTISANTPVWKQYINIGWNAYWQRKLRS